jgi:hypothetical protein
MCRMVWRPYGLIYKNPKNSQKCICKFVTDLVVDFQDGLRVICDSIYFIRVVNGVGECIHDYYERFRCI